MANKRTEPDDFDSRVGAEASSFIDPSVRSGVFAKLSRSHIERMAEGIVRFGEVLCDVALYPYQRALAIRIVMSVLLDDGQDITGLFSRQSGKTECLSVVVCAMIVMLPHLAKQKEIRDPRILKFKKGFWVGIFAPTRDQGETLHERIVEKMNSPRARHILADRALDIEIDDKRHTSSVNIPNGSLVRCQSAAKQARIEGKTYHFIVTEESQDIDPFVFKKSISPMLASTNGSVVKIGTCNNVRTDFYEACTRNARADLDRKKGQLQNHFQYDYTHASAVNPYYRKYIKGEITKLGFESDEFRMSYRLHWILERGMFVEPTLFEMMGKDYSPITFDLHNDSAASVDVAKEFDSTVVTIIQPDAKNGIKFTEDDFHHKKKILNWLELKGDDYVSQVNQIVNFLQNYRIKKLVVDRTGVGSAIFDMLADKLKEEIESGEIELVEFLASTQSNNDAALHLLKDMQNALIEYPNSMRAKSYEKQRKFVLQMQNLQKTYSSGTYLNIEAGEATPHKDYASSLMMGCWAIDTNGGAPEIQEDPNWWYASAIRQANQRGLSAERGRPLWK